MSTCDAWQLVKREECAEYKSEGLWYRHKKTGMEVFHLFNDDEENLFAFGFKTLNAASDGAAHVLEHSVLCGSKRYPLKDPFLQLNNQSVKTFLNAMTFPDKTLYPASSMVKADYFNLMAVYGDAVFNPLLSEETFAQEAHRFEVGEAGNVSVQGVVYNEMKGAYSSFDDIVSDYVIRYTFPGTPYAFDSGGDPVDIPSLTLEKLKAFHAEHYGPAHCRLFLYGNIPTETQLEFIETHFLKDLRAQDSSVGGGALHALEQSIYDCSFDKPQTVRASAPAGSGEKGETVLLNWVLGNSASPDSYMQAVLLSEILTGHDASPLTKALMQSGLGEDIAPNTGLECDLARLLFSCGMRGVKKGGEAKIERCINDVLSGLAQNGVSDDDLRAALMSVDFSQREVQRSSGPWSLVLMRRAFRGWLNGTDPFSSLKTRAAFERLKSRIALADGKAYLQTLVKKLFLDNPHRLLLTVVPDEEYDKKREKAYEKQCSSCTLSRDEIEKKQKALHAYQSKDDEKLRSLIPHLKPRDLEKKIDCIHTERTVIADIPAFVHNEAVNGIVYLIAAVPVDELEPELYPFLPFYAQVLTNVGFKGMDWAEAAAKSALITGGFGASVFTSAMTPRAAKLSESGRDSLLGRDWLFLRVKMLAEYATEGVDLLFDCFESPDFSDEKRIKDLALEYRNDFVSSIVPAGHMYALSRCARYFSRSKSVEELWSGLSQLYTAKRIAAMESAETAHLLSTIHEKLRSSGICVNITADKEGLPGTKKALQARLKAYASPKVPSATFCSRLGAEAFLPLGRIENTDESSKNLCVYTLPCETGFAASSFASSAFGTKEAVYESLFAHWFSNNVLWEKIRTVGGAYGAFASADVLERVFAFVTYRDPDPARSLDAFVQCLDESSSARISGDVLERTITGSYSKEVQPRSPSARGFTGFMRSLYGILDEEREEKLNILLSAGSSDLQNAASSLARRAECAKNALICGKYDKSTGIIIPLSV